MENLQATCWALVALSIVSRIGVVWIVLFFMLVLLPCALTMFMTTYSYQKHDRLAAADFTARLLAEIRKLEDAGNRTD